MAGAAGTSCYRFTPDTQQLLSLTPVFLQPHGKQHIQVGEIASNGDRTLAVRLVIGLGPFFVTFTSMFSTQMHITLTSYAGDCVFALLLTMVSQLRLSNL